MHQTSHGVAVDDLYRDPLSDQIYGVLKSAIISAEFRPGERLSLRELSDRFRLSATPIRDALRRLQTDGLIQVEPRRGTFVSEMNAEDVREIFESRRIVEQAAAEKLGTAPESTIQEISAIVDAMAGLIDGQIVTNYPLYLQLDDRLHKNIVSILQNERLETFYDGLKTHSCIARALVPAPQKRMPQTHLEHCAIVQAFKERDVESAKRAIAEHLGNASADILLRLPLLVDKPAQR
jgi:GntR family transcriptional regulator, rspAB operon transcriptional repressor